MRNRTPPVTIFNLLLTNITYCYVGIKSEGADRAGLGPAWPGPAQAPSQHQGSLGCSPGTLRFRGPRFVVTDSKPPHAFFDRTPSYPEVAQGVFCVSPGSRCTGFHRTDKFPKGVPDNPRSPGPLQRPSAHASSRPKGLQWGVRVRGQNRE